MGPKPRTSKPAHQNKVYRYLLHNRVVREPGEAWCTGTTTSDNDTQRTITDTGATETKKFYRVEITKP